MTGELTLASGLQVYYESSGCGLPVVCIPGWAYTTQVFARNLPALAKSYRAISFDPRGHGRSEVTTYGNDYSQHGRDLHDVLNALNVSEFVLMGWSLGVYDAYSYLDQFGFDGVKALIAIDESPRVIKAHADDWGEGTAEEVQALIDTVGTEAYLPFFRDYMAQGFVEPPADKLLDTFTESAASLSPAMASNLLASGAASDYTQLASIVAENLPVLNIVREDWAVQAQAWCTAHQPAAEFQVLGRHLMLYEFAEEFNRCILGFLERTQATHAD